VHFTAMRARALSFMAGLSCALSGSLAAQGAPVAPVPAPATAPAALEPGADLTVYLLTFGWGEVSWERFGHTAIWIKDRARGTDLTYNWGMFDFNQPRFVWRFVTGDTRYWMEAFDLNTMISVYRRENRSILAQELNLTPAQRLKLQQFVEWNALPEN
jgi:hypothetical protein